MALYLRSADMEHGQIRGQKRVRRCQLIHHTLSSHSVTEGIEDGDLTQTVASVVILAMTSGFYPLIVLSAQETHSVTSLLDTGKMLVWEVKLTNFGDPFPPLLTHRYRNACYISVSLLYVLQH